MSRLLSILALLLLVTAVSETAQSQGIFERARRAAERGAERAVEREAERRADRAVTGAIECAVGDRACAERARADGQEVTYVDESGNAVPAQQAEQAAQAGAAGVAAAAAPGQGVWANYDFVPGSRVLFYEDYSNDRVGNFPRRLQFQGGNTEIVQWEGGLALRANSRGGFDVPLPETLPQRFTIEFDFFTPAFVNDITVYPVDASGNPAGDNYIQVDPYGGVGVDSFGRGGIRALDNVRAKVTGQMTAIRVMVDGSYVKVYADEQRVANMPNADLGRTNALRFNLRDVRSEPLYIGAIRVAASNHALDEQLMTEGRASTHGILFATGSATIQPESTPTLQDIARALRQRGDMRLRIEGHTDNVGSADANLRLSEQRAQAVVAYLVQQEGIASSRLEAAGKGQAEPVGDNNTAEGRQTNRRVDLVVLN
jgi:OmpA-OmpF porin, OOP family